MPSHILSLICGEGYSYGDKEGIKPFGWYSKLVFFEGRDVTSNRLADAIDGFLPGSALTDAAWKARAFCHPVLVLAWIDNHLSHAVLCGLDGTNVHLQKLLCQPNRLSPEGNVNSNLLIAGTCLALWLSRCPLKAKSCHEFHGFRGFYEGTTKRRCFLQPPGCRQGRRHHLEPLDTHMQCSYEFVKSVESVAVFEGAKHLHSQNVAEICAENLLPVTYEFLLLRQALVVAANRFEQNGNSALARPNLRLFPKSGQGVLRD